MGMFSFNANAGETPETLKQKRAVADALLQQGLDMSPIQHPMQGLARIAQALSGNYARAWTDKKEAEGRKSAGDSFSKIMAAIWPGQTPAADAGPSFAAPPTRSSDMPPHAGDTFSKMVQIESGGNPNAVSPKGATGIAQIMPATARDPGFGLSNIFDFAKSRGVNVADNSDATLQGLLRNPEINRAFGQAYFEKMKELNGGDERLAAASYNAGPGAVQKAGGVPNIPETQAYVGKLGLNGQQPAAYQQPGAPQPAQAQGMPQIAQVFELLNNPYLNEGQKAVLGQVIKREFDRADPQTQLQIQAMMQGLEKGKLEINALKNPVPEYGFITGKDGAVFRTNKTSGNVETVYGGGPTPTDDQRELEQINKERASKGLPALGLDEWIQTTKKAGASSVNIDQKTEGAFEKKLAEGQAEAFNAMATEGMNAKADLAIVGELERLMQGQGGAMTGLAGFAAKYGIGGEGMDDIQAAQALINKLIPSQRQPGSGTMSDRDVDMFARSLPSLWNTPGGNQTILNVMRGLTQYKQAQGDIAQALLIGDIDRKEATRRLKALPNPLAGFTPTKENRSLDDLLKKYGN